MKTKQPLISVIMPCYNGEKFIGEAIESVINQTYKNWELIIVDDGSTDNSKKIIKQYCAADKRIQYIQHKKNKGIPFARNAGIKASNGEYIAFLDQDDLWLPDKLNNQIKVFKDNQESNLGLVFSYTFFLKESKLTNKTWSVKRIPKNLNNMPANEVIKCLFLRNFIPTITVLISKKCFNYLGLLDEKLIGGADDYEFFLRVAGSFQLKYLDIPLAVRREHENNFSKMERFFNDEIYIIEKIIKSQCELRKLKNCKLADLYYRLGRDYQFRGNFYAAKKAFLRSIRFNHWKVKYLLLFILCLFGRFGNFLLKIFTKVKRIVII